MAPVGLVGRDARWGWLEPRLKGKDMIYDREIPASQREVAELQAQFDADGVDFDIEGVCLSMKGRTEDCLSKIFEDLPKTLEAESLFYTTISKLFLNYAFITAKHAYTKPEYPFNDIALKVFIEEVEKKIKEAQSWQNRR